MTEPPVPMWQNPTEFGLFYDFIKTRHPESVLEIGSFYGGTLWQWTRLPEINVLVAVDMITDAPEHHDAVLKAREQWESWMDIGGERGIDFHNLVGPSTDWFIAEEVRANGPYDFVFIDGDHSYEGVKRDFAMYLPTLAEGGVVAFHDTRRHEPGVMQFAAELKEIYPTVEFFSPDWGAGILVVLP